MSITKEAIRTASTETTYTISSVVLNDGLVSDETVIAVSRCDGSAAGGQLITVGLVVMILLVEGCRRVWTHRC